MNQRFNLYPTWVFINVAQLKSITAAAELLSISQPAASAHIRSLESELKEVLLKRLPRGVSLTEAGQAYFEQALHVFAELERLEGVSQGQQQWGCVKLAASFTPGVFWLPARLAEFQSDHPDIQCKLTLKDSSHCVQRVLDYEVPMAVVGDLAMLSKVRGLQCELVAQDLLALTAPGGHPFACSKRLKRSEEDELLLERLILREAGSSTRSQAEAMVTRLGRFSRVLELSSSEGVKEAVIAGLGVAVLSCWSVARELESGILQQFADPRLRKSRNFYAIRRRDRPIVGPGARLWNCITSKPTSH